MITERLDKDPSDLITKLRRADACIARCSDVGIERATIVDREAKAVDVMHRELLSLLEELCANVRMLEAGKSSITSLVTMLRHDTSVLEHALFGGGSYSAEVEQSIAVQCVQSCRRLIDRMDSKEIQLMKYDKEIQVDPTAIREGLELSEKV